MSLFQSVPRPPWEKGKAPYIWAWVMAIAAYPLLGGAVGLLGLVLVPFTEEVGEVIAGFGVVVLLFLPFVIVAALLSLPLVLPVAAWAVRRGVAGPASGAVIGAVTGGAAGAVLDWLIESGSLASLSLGTLIGAIQGIFARAALVADWPEITKSPSVKP